MSDSPPPAVGPIEPAAASPRPPDAASGARGHVWLAPLLIGLIGYGGMTLQLAATFLAMIFPPVALVVGALLVIPAGLLIALVYRRVTERWRPIAAALLALIPAVLSWGLILGYVPFAWAIVGSQLGPLLVGVATGALSMLALPDRRWKLAGGGAALVIAIAALLPIATELAGTG
ncbi:hypothetical protein EDM22_01115 [Agromyces tardus]|jgi:signal transduction histidine kinase|uniref:Uncharacterized protein n=1 Tax=Agromyces tardus TaxID=2583849 RepID=A0A3M8AP92_9MICO|nr:hypothetical protein [Agromyces tardus]RNB52335.1 hypothetical protein EDM22_01115 [Agromyces tardus]